MLGLAALMLCDGLAALIEGDWLWLWLGEAAEMLGEGLAAEILGEKEIDRLGDAAEILAEGEAALILGLAAEIDGDGLAADNDGL